MKTIPEINDKVTIHNIRPGCIDRSYQDEHWQVVGVNKTHVQLKCTRPRGILPPDVIIVLITEYEFSEAETFIT